MISLFCCRLICGASLCWALMPRRQVTCGFFRIQHLVVLGLSALAAITLTGNEISELPMALWPTGVTRGIDIGIALSVADVAVVTDVYPAREAPIQGVTGEIVVRAARRAGVAVEWIPDKADLVSHLERVATDGDVVITLGRSEEHTSELQSH